MSGQLVPVTISNGALVFNTVNAVTLPSLTLSGNGGLAGTGAVTVTGAFNATGHTSYLSGTGTFTTQGVSTVSMAQSTGFLRIIDGKTWVNEGTLTIAGDDYIYFGWTSGNINTLTNAAGATLNLSTTNATPLVLYTGTATLNNFGTLNQTAAGAHAIANGVAFNNSGTVNVDAGTLTIAGGGTDSGLYDVDTGTTLNFSGGTRNLGAGTNITGLGTLAVSGATVNANNLLGIAATGAALNVSSGVLNVNGGAAAGTLAPVTVSGGTLNFNTTSAVTLPSLTLNTGALGGTGAVTVTGAFNVTGRQLPERHGHVHHAGREHGEHRQRQRFVSLIDGKTWVNEGTLTVAGDDSIYFGYSSGGTNTLTNAAGATLNLSSTNATPLSFYTGTARLNNFGTLNQTVAGAHAIAGGIAFNNSGTVNVDAGTLTIAGGGTDTGLYDVDTGTTLNFSGGTRNLGAGTNITGLGTLAVSGATVNANNLLGIAATGAALNVSSGVLNVNGDVGFGHAGAGDGERRDVEFQHHQRRDAAEPHAEHRRAGRHRRGHGDGGVQRHGGVSYLSGTGTFTTQGVSTVNIANGSVFVSLIDGKTWVNEGTLTVAGDDCDLLRLLQRGREHADQRRGGDVEPVEHERDAAAASTPAPRGSTTSAR